MKLNALFSNNKKIGSRAISFLSSMEAPNMLLEKVPSHCAVLINGHLVVESIASGGVRIIPYSKWKEINNEVANIPLENLMGKFEHEPENVRELINEMWGKKYDWKGLLYFSFVGLRYIAFKVPVPKINSWEQEDRFFCTEFMGRLLGKSYSMTSPVKMYLELKDKLPTV